MFLLNVANVASVGEGSKMGGGGEGLSPPATLFTF